MSAYMAGIVECARFGEHLRSTRHRRSECPTFHPAHRGERNPVVEAGDLLTKRVRGDHPEFCLMVEGKHRGTP